MSTEENKMLVRRQFDEIWNGGNWATADELYAPDYVNHDAYNPDQGTGPDGFKQRVGGYRSVLHGFDLRIERQIAEGDWVETHWSLRGTHGGELEGTAPTGKSVYGRAARATLSMASSSEDGFTGIPSAAFRQIGAVPPPQA
jgi:predicted ester cyclase